MLNYSSYFNFSLLQYFPEDCPAGTYRTEDKTKCETCSVNMYSEGRAESCTDCQLGKVSNEQKSACGIKLTDYKVV